MGICFLFFMSFIVGCAWAERESGEERVVPWFLLFVFFCFSSPHTTCVFSFTHARATTLLSPSLLCF